MRFKNRGILVFLASMLVMDGLSRAASSFTVARVEVEQPNSGKITYTVTGGGTVDNKKEYAVYAAPDVLVEEVAVRQGQNVRKGDVLARLDRDSLQEKIESLSGEIEIMRLQSIELAAAQQRERQNQNRTRARAGEDYENTLSENKRKIKEAKENVKAAEEKVKEAKRQAKKQTENDYEKKREELEEEIKAAEKAYKDAEEQEESAVLSAKRAVEDAAGEPDSDYDMQMLQMEIYQNQRDLNELYMKKSMGEEGLEEQIRALEDNLRVLWLRQQEMERTKKKQEEERERTLLRAQEDYSRTVKKYAKLVDEAKQKLDEANLALDEFLESDGEEFLEDEFVKAAEEALKAANKALEAARRQAENEKQQAKRNLEDASIASTAGSQPEIDRIQIMERQRQLAILQQAEENKGKITAQMEGTVTSVQLEAGQRTGGSAVFLIIGTSGGMNFATEISREDAVYVTVGDTVTLRTANEEYEELSVVSVEEGEQKETVKVNVFVPKDLISPGEYAQMELTKTSREYGTIVPISAIHTENEKNFVYVMALEETVLGEQYTAKCVDVTIAQKNEACAALTDTELQADSQIIVSSDRMLSEGERVRFKEEAVE